MLITEQASGLFFTLRLLCLETKGCGTSQAARGASGTSCGHGAGKASAAFPKLQAPASVSEVARPPSTCKSTCSNRCQAKYPFNLQHITSTLQIYFTKKRRLRTKAALPSKKRSQFALQQFYNNSNIMGGS